MDQQLNYQFVMMPQQLSSCLDANCGKMLSTLIGLHSILSNEDGWFYRSNLDLQDDTRLSETLVRATLDTLYQAGIIDIDCIGKGRGHRSNRIHINFESFKKYQQYSFNDIRNNPDLWINTIKYKGSGFATSYSQKVRTNMEVSQGTSQDISQNTSQKVRTNTDTINTTYTINTIKDNISNKEDIVIDNKEDKVKETIIYFVNNHLDYDYILLSCNKDRFFFKYRDTVLELSKSIEDYVGDDNSIQVVLNSIYDYVQETGVIP